MESNVKFKQIAVFEGDGNLFAPCLYAVDEDGQLWRKQFGCNWVKNQMPTDWQKELSDANFGLIKAMKDRKYVRFAEYARECATRIAHAAFMLHPGLREE